MDLDQLKTLIQILEKSTLAEIEIEEEGRRIILKKPQAVSQAPQSIQYLPTPQPMMAGNHAHSTQVIMAEAPASSSAPSQVNSLDGKETIDSPMVGTFYTAAAPGEEPFVAVGDRIQAEQTVCIVEAMKLMNEVTAKAPCIIEQILVENGEPIEYGQPLFVIRSV